MIFGMSAAELAIILAVVAVLFAPRMVKLGDGFKGFRRKFKAGVGDGAADEVEQDSEGPGDDEAEGPAADDEGSEKPARAELPRLGRRKGVRRALRRKSAKEEPDEAGGTALGGTAPGEEASDVEEGGAAGAPQGRRSPSGEWPVSEDEQDEPDASKAA